uniref:Peptidase M14 domain-containing protein n=1 Tax=Glossina pallidipes TaxID=7398 RepID=A0A1A9ZLG4_GLOPL
MADEEKAPEAAEGAPKEEKEGEEGAEKKPEEETESEGKEKPIIDCPKPAPKKTLKQFQEEREKEKEEKAKKKEKAKAKADAAGEGSPEEKPAEEAPAAEAPAAEAPAEGEAAAKEKGKKKKAKEEPPPVYRRLDWTFYPTLCEIYNWMDVIVEKCSKVVTNFEIGRSHEGRVIRGLKISFKSGNKAIFIESNIHAREWITSSAATCAVMELLFSKDPEVRRTAAGIDWYILPVFNVDGFVYSQEKERLWRKSRRPLKEQKTPECIGVDLNRNFNHQWGVIKNEPCNDQYGGSAAESEPEVKQLVQFINTIPEGTLKVYVALHAAGQAVITPWSYTKEEQPKDHKELMEVAKAFVEAAYPRFRTRYVYGPAAEILNTGEFCGTSTDWAYGVKNIPISLGIELPGKGTKKPFELPTESILRVSTEFLDGLVGMIKAVGELGFIEKIPEPPKKEIKPKYERPKKEPKKKEEGAAKEGAAKEGAAKEGAAKEANDWAHAVKCIPIALSIELPGDGTGEWITSAACTYLIMELLYSRDPDVRELAESLDWWIIPVLNVDGFVYSHENERLWRKSRRPASPDCIGIDLNRNFNYKWALRRNADPGSNVYSGPYPESEPEVQQLVEFINNNIPEGSIKIYVALHSAAQAVLAPWTHTKVPPQTYAILMYVAKAFVESLYPRYHTKYRCGSSANVLKMFSGGSKDWAYAVKRVPIAFTIELPGKGTLKRFELPETMITRVGAELLDGFRGMIKAVKFLDRRSLFPKKRPTYRILDWTFYPTLCEIYSWMDFIIKERPNVVTGFDIGRSYEGRLIRGLKLSFKPGKKAIFIESNIHAREWITSAACTYLIMELVFSINPDVRELAESLDWWIVPVLNVDGFVYSHEKERLWRKSRKPVSSDCVGVDLNRNFNYKWEIRRCADPSSNTYSGPSAESEPEVEQLTNFISNYIPRDSIKIYVALHSPLQAVHLPWSHTKVPPKDYEDLLYVANAFAEALHSRYGTKYHCGSSANLLSRMLNNYFVTESIVKVSLNLGLFSGGSKDWAYGEKNIPIAYTIELPGKGKPSPYELPQSSILRTSAEFLDGFIGMIRAVKKLGYI